MINTHKIMAENIIKYANTKSIYLINNKRFIWGNVKPDCAPKYKFKKHYFNESINMIIEKIIHLSSLSLEEIYYDITIGKFSEELGVICHFLCDFFCAPHYYRWEFKSTSAVKHHMMYEKNLAKVAKSFDPTGIINTHVDSSNIEEFIMQLQKQYDGTINYYNDLTFSYYVCDSVLNMILNNVFINENKVIKVI
ncbi:zinc dependent phospholipase C family protein [Clostridium beijerinckii]|uniref:zinc dependent phospholipase C family protein n=1 Tax=Clostridium beijerinckii TaxID=1520 RepID=UPI00037526D6|nr:zinc dependent phospholipase C family protein [Clostridium beijerinckii]